MSEIINLINKYLKLKDDYKEYNKENLYNVFYIFENEVVELNNILLIMCKELNKKILRGNLEVSAIEQTMYKEEENLLNEIADVILTVARLIKEFKLDEPLIEMMEYKYHRQCIREEKRKNG